MGGHSNVNSTVDSFNADDAALQKMQAHMKTRSLNTLNDEIVRSAAYFGFDNRPEPTAVVTDAEDTFNPDNDSNSVVPTPKPQSGIAQ